MNIYKRILITNNTQHHNIMAQTHLVLIPCPGAGHLFSAVEQANRLVGRDHRLFITVLIIRLPFDDPKGKSSSLDPPLNLHPHVRCLHLPDDGTFHDTAANNFFTQLVESYKPHVSQAVAELASDCQSASPQHRLAGFVLDMFCTSMIDVADSFRVPSYLFFTSNSAMLGLLFYLQKLRDDYGKDVVEYCNSGEELVFPGFVFPFPAKLLPSIVLRPETAGKFLDHTRRFRKTRGIVVNTFLELEPYPLKFLQSELDMPKVYPVGPIVNVRGLADDDTRRQDEDEVLRWLDQQPAASVVFLCFGSMGSFDEDQVKEIAIALIKSGYRFLWSLRRPQEKGKIGLPSDYGGNVRAVLPEGFLERTTGVGRVIGWAPQAKILAHPSTGGFVSHCGWNSILESIWFGVPMASWPLYAEQQLNAFQLVKEMGLAAEIRIDYRRDFRIESGATVSADEIGRGIRELMEDSGEKRRKVKEMKDISRAVLKGGSSSYVALGEFINDLLGNAS